MNQKVGGLSLREESGLAGTPEIGLFEISIIPLEMVGSIFITCQGEAELLVAHLMEEDTNHTSLAPIFRATGFEIEAAVV